jgi:hypothetical protein
MLLCGFSACAFRAADRGCRRAPGLPCALSIERVERSSKARAKSAARMRRRVCDLRCELEDDADASRSVIASAARQSRIRQRKDSGLLRCARHDHVESACPLPGMAGLGDVDSDSLQGVVRDRARRTRLEISGCGLSSSRGYPSRPIRVFPVTNVPSTQHSFRIKPSSSAVRITAAF